ncbi:MAG TPA: hypothetical protein VFL84_11100 [Gammaproteobacteria bacterium]|nr:hypothetical protein [Gammaproteobacteria bacterium]
MGSIVTPPPEVARKRRGGDADSLEEIVGHVPADLGPAESPRAAG